MSKTSSKSSKTSSAKKPRLTPFWSKMEKRLLKAIDEQQRLIDHWQDSVRSTAAQEERGYSAGVTFGLLELRRMVDAKTEQDRLRAMLNAWALLSE